MKFSIALVSDDRSLLDSVQAMLDVEPRWTPRVQLMSVADFHSIGTKVPTPDFLLFDDDLGLHSLLEKCALGELPCKCVAALVSLDNPAAQHLYDAGIGVLTKPLQAANLINEVQVGVARCLGIANSLTAPSSSSEHYSRRLTIPSSDRYLVIDLDHCVYAASSGNYTTLHLDDGSEVLVTKQLGQFEQRLSPHAFFRAHHSYIINREHIDCVLRQAQLQVVMTTGDTVPVSRRRKQALLTWLQVL